jgi:bifunctional DNA-binding transcriptional regulator/antitoxin component of YhaV-PrlF toxin-antitoxin module
METQLTDKFVTQVPAAIRRDEGLEPGATVLRWRRISKGRYEVVFRRRKTMDDLIGLAPGASGGDSVQAKRMAQSGGH